MHCPIIDNILSSLSTSPPKWTVEQEAELLEPYTYITSTPGKGVCKQIIQALDHWLQVPPARLTAIIRVVELLNNASLIVDDIEDGSELRRGKLAAHKVYGIGQTINAANYVYFLAYQEVLRIPYLDEFQRPDVAQHGLRLVHILNDEMLALHRGQGREIRWRDHVQYPSEEEYIEMAKDKTAGVLRIAVRLMTECATTNASVNYVPLIDLMGIWYQIRDDYMNLRSSLYAEKKGFADDLAEGKFSFPIIHGIRESYGSKYILDVLRQRPKSPALKQSAITYLDEVTHSFEYTLGALGSLEAQARAEATRLGGNPMLETILDKLSVK